MIVFYPVIQYVAAELLAHQTIERDTLDDMVAPRLAMPLLLKHVLPIERWFNRQGFPWTGCNTVFMNDSIEGHKSPSWVVRQIGYAMFEKAVAAAAKVGAR